MPTITSIGIAKEVESPENPGGLEKCVAMIPEDVKMVVEAGIKVSVEAGAGEGVGFSDSDYKQAGAEIVSHAALYKARDMVIKLKGPALADVKAMDRGTILFCMAHFHSFPDRAKLLEECGINVIAMEEILESPKRQSAAEILGRLGMAEALAPAVSVGLASELDVRVIGWSDELNYALRRAGNRDPASLKLLPLDLKMSDCDAMGDKALYIYDSREFKDEKAVLRSLADKNTNLYDIGNFIDSEGAEAITDYREDHEPFEFGMRRIQCLHETGMAGARFGMEMLKRNKPESAPASIKAVVLGYGNVGRGAIHELHQQGVRDINILGRTHTVADAIVPFLEGADIIINGADQPIELRGKNFLITNDHVKDVIPKGSVVIDLVGGSKTNRSPVEPVLECTFLMDPDFERDGITISAVRGWPMLGMMRESNLKYSSQIKDILIGPENLITGIEALTNGVERALVCGPHA